MKRLTIRRAYERRVAALAAQLAPRFRAREFDPRRGDDNGDLPFLRLEEFCARLPICRNSASAKLVIAASRYADDAAWYYIESCSIHPVEGKAWNTLAAWCLARDIHDEAIRRGWSRQIERRARIEMTEPTLYERRGITPPTAQLAVVWLS
jgi:hypothetical protein